MVPTVGLNLCDAPLIDGMVQTSSFSHKLWLWYCLFGSIPGDHQTVNILVPPVPAVTTGPWNAPCYLSVPQDLLSAACPCHLGCSSPSPVWRSTRITWWSLHWWLQNERESRGSGGHQPPFPEWWDNLPPTVQKTARQQQHLCSWGYSHQSGTELLPTHGPSPSWRGSLLWLNVLFAGNRGWRHREPFYLPYHEPALVIEWQGHTCSFLLGTKPLWHWRKWKSGPTSKRDPRPRYRPTGKCPLYRYETTGQLLHSEVGSNQVGCSCTWQRSLSCETNTGTTEKVPAPNQSWRGCNHPTSNWPYQGHQIPYLVPRTTDWLSPLWSNTDHWPYAAGVCTVTGMSWWILHSRLVECSLRGSSWDLHSGIPARSGILLSDMM